MTVYRSRHLKKSLFQLFGFWYACVVKRLPFGLQKATYSDGSDLQNAGDENTQGSLSSDSQIITEINNNRDFCKLHKAYLHH